MAALDLVNIQKSFGATQILHDISISLGDGEFLVLVGPSGCGKSTLMNIIAGLEEPSGGSVRLGGADITALPPADRNVSMVFQSYALYPNMTVARNIEFPLRMRKVDKAHARRARAQRGEAAADRAPARAQAPPALRRTAPARGDRAGAGARAQAVSVGRAAVQPRRAAAPRHAHRDQEAAPAAGRHHRLRHPRPDRGDDARHAHRGHEGRRGAAAGHALRGLQPPGEHLRGRVHGLAPDEPAAGASRRAPRASSRSGSRTASAQVCASSCRPPPPLWAAMSAGMSSPAFAPRR